MDLNSLFKMGLEQNATELIFSTGSPIFVKISGEIKALTSEPLKDDVQRKILEKIAGMDRIGSFFSDKKDMDLTVDLTEVGRFRLNLFHQNRGFTMVFRPIKKRIPTLEEMNLPQAVIDLTDSPEGLIIINGPPGSGKSTIYAGMIERISSRRKCVVISLENPIEYIYQPQKSLIVQREIGRDVLSFSSALEVIHHQNPEVIAVDDMEEENLWLKILKLAATQHLVIVTLGTVNSIQAVEYILHQFPDFQRKQVLNLLGTCLKTVISQKLMYSKDKKPVFMKEILMMNQNINKLFLEDKLFMLPTAMKGGTKEGQLTFEENMKQLVSSGILEMPSGGEMSEEVARTATDLSALEKQLYDSNIDVRKRAETELKKLAAEGNRAASQVLEEFSRFFITNFEHQKRGPRLS